MSTRAPRGPVTLVRALLAGGLIAGLAVAAPPLAAQADAPSANREAMIRSAMSAAPAEISAKAAIQDWQGNTLREGSNGWTCMPDMADKPGDSPMCLDEVWMKWADAWMNKKSFSTDRVAFGYMLQGDFPTSNTDPYATEATPDNEWVENSGPHVMILVPDVSMLEGLSRTPHERGPWVMWEGTPYVHVMMPAPRQP